jgi:hypothetical protein
MQDAFIVARSLSHALITRPSSARSGCVVERPFLSRVTRSTRLSISTCESFRLQASETRNPWRNISNSRQTVAGFMPHVLGGRNEFIHLKGREVFPVVHHYFFQFRG